MSIPLTINGAVFEYPVDFDESWGIDATGWAQAVTNGMLQMAGGSFPLTAEVDFGGSFGIKALYLKSRETNPASTGIIRLASVSAGVVWRNNANTGNLVLTTDAADNLFFNGVPVGTPGTLTDAHIFVGNAFNVQADVAMSGDVHITNTGATTIQPGAVTDSKITGPISIANGGTNSGTTLNNDRIIISSAGAIVEAAAITGDRAVKSNSSGIPVSATLTATQLENTAHLYAYRRPVLQWSSVTQVNLETGINGTAGQAAIIFPDGDYRTDSSTNHINFVITRNAVLSGGAQSGLRTSLTEAANTWYALYAVKVTDSTTDFVVVGDTLTPVQANYATLNSNFGTSGWIYLGQTVNGDNSSSTMDIPKFFQCGGTTIFYNTATIGGRAQNGLRLANTAGATELTYTYASGTDLGSNQIPSHLGLALYDSSNETAAASSSLAGDQNSATTGASMTGYPNTFGVMGHRCWAVASLGFRIFVGVSVPIGIGIAGFADGVLGVGSNPLL